MKKAALIGTICSGVAVVGAGVGITAAILLNGSGALSDLSDQEAIQQGFENLFEPRENDCAKVMEYLSDKPFTIYADFDINSIIEADVLSGSKFNFSADVDAENKKALISAFGSVDNTDVDFDLLINESSIALKSNLFDEIYYIDIDELINLMDIDNESLSSSIDYSPIMNMFDVSSYSEEFKNGLKEALNNSLDELIENMDITRAEDSEEINGVEATEFECTIHSSDFINIYLNLLEYVFESEEFRNMFFETFSSFEPSNDFTIEEVNKTFDELVNELQSKKADIISDLSEEIGESFDFSVFLTDDVEIVRLATQFNLDKDTSKILDITLDISDIGYTFTISDDEETSIELEYKADNGEFAFALIAGQKDTNVINGKFSGTYDITDESIEIDFDTCNLSVVAYEIFDLSAKFGIKELTDDIEEFDGDYVSFEEFDFNSLEPLEELFN